MKQDPNKPHKYTCYLNERTMSAMRGDEPLSARLNAIVDRYLFTVSACGAPMRALFSDDEWRTLLDAYSTRPDELVSADDLFRWWSTGPRVIGDGVLCMVRGIPPDEFMVLIELLETELMTGVALTPAGDS